MHAMPPFVVGFVSGGICRRNYKCNTGRGCGLGVFMEVCGRETCIIS